MPAFLALNVALALAALALGGHWVEWHFRDLDDVASRTSAFELGAQVHAASAVAALAAALGRTHLNAPIISGLFGTFVFSGALYAFATLGWKATMPGTVIGSVLLIASWLWIAAKLWRDRQKAG
ncbi:MAG: DUF423 domain-containing protein [Pseudomonadota bacterium]